MFANLNVRRCDHPRGKIYCTIFSWLRFGVRGNQQMRKAWLKYYRQFNQGKRIVCILVDAWLPGDAFISLLSTDEMLLYILSFVEVARGIQLRVERFFLPPHFYHQEKTGPLYWKRWVKVSLKLRNAAVVPTWPLDLLANNQLVLLDSLRLRFRQITFPRWLEASVPTGQETFRLSKLGSDWAIVLAWRPFGVRTCDDRTPYLPIFVNITRHYSWDNHVIRIFGKLYLEDHVKFIT